MKEGTSHLYPIRVGRVLSGFIKRSADSMKGGWISNAALRELGISHGKSTFIMLGEGGTKWAIYYHVRYEMMDDLTFT